MRDRRYMLGASPHPHPLPSPDGRGGVIVALRATSHSIGAGLLGATAVATLLNPRTDLVMAFTQQAPALDNQYLDDRLLRSLLRRVMPPHFLSQMEPGLTEFGDLVAGEWHQMQLRDQLRSPFAQRRLRF